MRKWHEPLATLAMVLVLAGIGVAQQFQVQEVASVDGVIQTIAICDNEGSLDVTADTSSGTVAGAFAVEVFNLAASTDTLNCGFSPSVSSATTSAWYGREVAPGIGVIWQLRQSIGTPVKKVYCRTQDTNGCTSATITQLK